jgi:hypothetical protein
MQGSVWGITCCVVLMDKLGQPAYSKPELLYYYRDVVATHPLHMVDDVLGIQKCSAKSSRLNNAIHTFFILEKVTLSEKSVTLFLYVRVSRIALISKYTRKRWKILNR